MSNAVVTLKKGEGRALKQGGAWIFDNEIASILGAYENGDIVLVRDFDGYPMGRGFINEHSKIRIRMMTRNIDQEIDEAFLRKRVAGCLGIPQKSDRHIKLPPDLWRGRLPAGTRSG